MAKWILLLTVVLSGCASYEERQRQEQARADAIVAHYTERCRLQGVDMNNKAAVGSCRLTMYQQDVLMSRALSGASFGNALQGMGDVLMAPSRARQPMNCTTRPTYGGRTETECY